MLSVLHQAAVLFLQDEHCVYVKRLFVPGKGFSEAAVELLVMVLLVSCLKIAVIRAKVHVLRQRGQVIVSPFVKLAPSVIRIADHVLSQRLLVVVPRPSHDTSRAPLPLILLRVLFQVELVSVDSSWV